MRVKTLALFFTSALAILALALTYFASVDSSDSPNEITLFSATEFEAARDDYKEKSIAVPSDTQTAISRIYTERTQSRDLPPGTRGTDVALSNDIPYFPYWQSGDKKYRFHPMAYGGFLSRLSNDTADAYLVKLRETAVEVGEKGGLLWFYPDNYAVSRMLNRFVPSAISQGQILGALVDLSRGGNKSAADLARRAYLGLVHPYARGGVNLSNRALLEIPLYDAPPEIILNGWLNALLFLRSYVRWSNDQEAEEMLMNDIGFLADIIHTFHNPRTNLSLYSDLTPYRIELVSTDAAASSYTVFYDSLNDALENVAVPLLDFSGQQRSPYENHIYDTSATSPNVHAWISMAQEYETYVVSNKPFELRVDAGVYDPLRATPVTGGVHMAFKSKPVREYNVVMIKSRGNEFFRGYPTNFSKDGTLNFYHVYHVVALACIVGTFDMPDEQRRRLRDYLLTWKKTINQFPVPKNRRFATFDKVFSGIATYHDDLAAHDWQEILSLALQR